MQTIRKPFTTIAACMLASMALCPGLVAQQSPALADEVQPRQPGALVVLSGTSAEALLLDPVQNRVLARFETGPEPQDVALSPDGRFAYVTSYGWEPTGSADGPDAPLATRGVTVLDLARRQVHAVFQPDQYGALGGITVGEGGDRIWMTSETERGVVEMDAHSGEVKMLWKMGGALGNQLAVSHDARRVFVSNTEVDKVTIIDRVTVVPNQVTTGSRPTGMALTPNGRELWVANSGDHTISVIRGIRRPREIERFPSGGMEPVRISFHEGRGEAWVSNRGSRSITVLGIADAAKTAEIELPGEPDTITFSDDGRHAYVSSPASHQVFVIDVENGSIVESLDAGSRPTGIAWSQHGAN